MQVHVERRTHFDQAHIQFVCIIIERSFLQPSLMLKRASLQRSSGDIFIFLLVHITIYLFTYSFVGRWLSAGHTTAAEKCLLVHFRNSACPAQGHFSPSDFELG